MKTVKYLVVFIFIFPLFITTSCKKDNKNNKTDSLSLADSVLPTDETLEKAQDIFYSLPAPNEVSMILLESEDIYYDENKLNPISNAEKYTTNIARALNLGIYSADLSYASIYDQNQTVVNYMATAKKLAESLGILEAFNEETIDRLEKNLNNRDSIANIIAETYMRSDAFLKESNREEIGSLIMIGGWIEGLYLALDIAKEEKYKNENLVSSIIEQELSMEIISDFIKNFKNKNLLNEIAPDLNEIEEAYRVLYEHRQANKNGNLQAPEKYIENLYNTVSKIRNKYTQMF